MDTHLADIEGRVKLTRGQSERHSFISMLETFSESWSPEAQNVDDALSLSEVIEI